MKKSLDAPYWGVLFLLLAWGIALMLLSSCSAEKRAIRQTNNALIKFPAVVAKIAREAFPCYVIKTENKIDSTDFKKWRDSVYTLNAFYNDLFNHIEPILIHDTTNNCTLYKDNEIKFLQKINYQKNLIAELNEKIDNIKPIKDSTKNWFEDSAKIEVMQSVINSQDGSIAKLQKSNTDLSETVKRKNKWILYLWLAVALSIVGFIIKLILKYK